MARAVHDPRVIRITKRIRELKKQGVPAVEAVRRANAEENETKHEPT